MDRAGCMGERDFQGLSCPLARKLEAAWKEYVSQRGFFPYSSATVVHTGHVHAHEVALSAYRTLPDTLNLPEEIPVELSCDKDDNNLLLFPNKPLKIVGKNLLKEGVGHFSTFSDNKK